MNHELSVAVNEFQVHVSVSVSKFLSITSRSPIWLNILACKQYRMI